MRIALAVAVLFTTAVVLGTSAKSTAAKAVRGAHYSGRLVTGNPAPPRVTFDVSRDGAEIRHLEITYPPLLCALGGMTPPQQKAGPARVTPAGAFAQTVSFATPAGRVFATIAVKGRFQKHRRASGKARVRWIGGFKSGCGGTVAFSARAR